jgi:F0F1-type ATP synthase assembly protein I
MIGIATAVLLSIMVTGVLDKVLSRQPWRLKDFKLLALIAGNWLCIFHFTRRALNTIPSDDVEGEAATKEASECHLNL